MPRIDRRQQPRRGPAYAANAALGAALTMERREKRDRRQVPRRRADMQTIAQIARVIGAGETRLDVIVDGVEGLRLVALFSCGCNATEPVGAGKPSVCIAPCGMHAEPPVMRERRRI